MPSLPLNRIVARRQNQPTYRGNLCSVPFHGRERYTSDGKCVKCASTRDQQLQRTLSRFAVVRASKQRSRGQPGRFSQHDIEALFEKQHKQCLCGVRLTKTEKSCRINHIMPLSRGGTNWPHNLQLLCARCNDSKRDQTMQEWRPDLVRELTPDEIEPQYPETVSVLVKVRQ